MNMNREILRIALPNIVSNITVPLMGIVSTAIAGHWGSDTAATIGALAIGVSIFNFIYWNCSFVRMGTSGLTAQAFGAGNFRECTNMQVRALLVAGGMGLLMLLLQYPLGELALWGLNGNDMTREYFYARIWAVPAGILLFGFNGWFTGMQNALIPMFTAITVNVVHVLCSLWFAFGLDMGIVGIAYASVIAQWTGVGLSLLLLSLALCAAGYLFAAYVMFRVGEKFRVGRYRDYLVPVWNLALLCDCGGVTRLVAAGLALPAPLFW